MLQNRKKLRIVRTVLWMLLAVMLILIFCFSSQSGEESSGRSIKAAEAVLRLLRPDYEKMPAYEREMLLSRANTIIRKGAHFAEYALLAFVLHLLLKTYPLKMRALLSWIGATLYAVTDEVHQLYVGERMGSAWDVLIDSCGAAAGVALAIMLAHRNARKRRKV